MEHRESNSSGIIPTEGLKWTLESFTSLIKIFITFINLHSYINENSFLSGKLLLRGRKKQIENWDANNDWKWLARSPSSRISLHNHKVNAEVLAQIHMGSMTVTSVSVIPYDLGLVDTVGSVLVLGRTFQMPSNSNYPSQYSNLPPRQLPDPHLTPVHLQNLSRDLCVPSSNPPC